MGFVLIILIILMGFILYRKVMPAILCLPLFAVLIGAVALFPGAVSSFVQDGLPGFFSEMNPLFDSVIAEGSVMLKYAYIAVVLGAILASHVRETGVAEEIVRFAAEFGGDSPFVLSLVLTLVTALLFTTLGGLGAVIMVATLTLPVLRSVGVSGKVAGVSFLLALSLGGTLNPVNWQIYRDVLGLAGDTVIGFALSMFAIFAVITALYLAWRLLKTARARLTASLLTAGVIALVALSIKLGLAGKIWGVLGVALWALLAAGLMALWVGAIVRFIAVALKGRGQADAEATRKPSALAYAAVIVPLLHILVDALARAMFPVYKDAGISMPFIAALALGVLYSILASYQPDAGNIERAMRSFFEGFKDAAPAVLLMFGIGMLLKATMLPETSAVVKPLLEVAVPGSPIPYVIVFTIFAPLALYRGPLNIWGMGSGIIGIVKSVGRLTSPMIMGAFFSVGMMQGVCDPTNTHNVWVANHEGVEVLDLTKEAIPWVWAGVFLGLIAAALTLGW